MAHYITVCLSLLLLVAVVHASQAEKIEVRDVKVNSSGYYPADSLNLVTLGLINGKKYAFVSQNCTWFEASYFCNAYGMDLVTIETQNENDLIMEQIVALGMDANHYFFTAAHKLGRSTWLWLNGENMIFSDWATGNPANPANEHCMVLYKGDWHDYTCFFYDTATAKRGFICEERSV